MHKKSEFYSRLRRSVGKVLAVLLCGAAYYLFVRVTGWSIPCVFYLVTHKFCPGCGITRMFLAIGELDFSKAFHMNAFVLCLLPFALLYGLWKWICFCKTGESRTTLWETVSLLLVFAFTIVFWVMRNMPQFEFLAPY